MFNDDVFSGDRTESRGVNARGTRRVMMPRRRWLSWLRGRCPSRRGTLLLLGLVTSADPTTIIAIAAAPATTSTPDKAAAA